MGDPKLAIPLEEHRVVSSLPDYHRSWKLTVGASGGLSQKPVPKGAPNLKPTAAALVQTPQQSNQQASNGHSQ